jgi:hypothetical protein
MFRPTKACHRRRRSAASALAAVASLCLAACGTAEPAKWVDVAPDGAGFAVSLPEQPKREQHISATPSGDVQTDVYSADRPGGGFYIVVVEWLPPTTDSEGASAVILDSACERTAGSALGTLASKKVIVVGNRPGREVEIDVPSTSAPGGGKIRGRIVLAGNRLYQTLALVPKGEITAETTNHFLDSFRLTDE